MHGTQEGNSYSSLVGKPGTSKGNLSSEPRTFCTLAEIQRLKKTIYKANRVFFPFFFFFLYFFGGLGLREYWGLNLGSHACWQASVIFHHCFAHRDLRPRFS
jgi:hypothetical protein